MANEMGPAGRIGISAAAVAALVLGACAAEPEAQSDGAASEIIPEILMNGERLFPESITSDAAGNIYIGSNPGVIYRARRGAETAEEWAVPSADNGLQSVFGVLADDARGLLWVCSNPNTLVQPPQTGPASLKAFTLDDGMLHASYDFPADAGPSLCNDMAIADNGDIYASDTTGGRVFKLTDGGETLEIFAADEEFATIDGIAIAEDGTIYINAIQRNTLVRVNVDAGGNFTDSTVLTLSREVAGPDGLRPLGGNRFLQSEGNSGLITVVTIDGDNAEIETIAEGIDYASSVTEVDGRAFYPEGKLSYLFDPNKQMEDPGEFRVRNVAIPAAE